MEEFYNNLMNDIITQSKKGLIDIDKTNQFTNDNLNKDFFVKEPLSISLNEYYQFQHHKGIVNVCPSDVIKVSISFSDGKNVQQFANTFKIDNQQEAKLYKFLNYRLKQKLERFIKERQLEEEKDPENELTTDDLCIFIKNEALKHNLQVVPNIFSESLDNQKWFAVEFKKVFDENDILTTRPNFCFQLCKGDVFNLTVLFVNCDAEFKEGSHKSGFYKFTDVRADLKLKSSRDFYNKSPKNKIFFADTSDSKTAIAINECVKQNVLENVPVLFNKIGDNTYLYKSTLFI